MRAIRYFSTFLSVLLLAALVTAFPANAQDIDYGDDSGEFSRDGECDDPRFEGPGVSIGFSDHLEHDATDCREAYEAGTATLVSEDPDRLDSSAIDFGDDEGGFSKDGECDDPRFTGGGASGGYMDHLMHDAGDCRIAYADGTISLFVTDPASIDSSGIDFGDDTGDYAEDGECDDLRFDGPGASYGYSGHTMHDAADCRAAFEAGAAILVGNASGMVDSSGINFGDDSGEYSEDGECDDPRFSGSGTSNGAYEEHEMHDASDCREAFEAGVATLVGDPGMSSGPGSTDIDFGDDAAIWSNDGECDDPRFTGPGMANALDAENVRHDATDCRSLFDSGQIQLADKSGGSATESGSGDIDYGDDSGDWANDGECDDPRFSGSGASDGFDSHLMHDASDCREAMEAGTVTFAGGGSPDAGSIDYGDDSGDWANDGECDDPRFSGSGASDGFDSHLFKDATDCREAMDAGTVTFNDGGTTTDIGGIDYGDDSGEWANDGECDDPRFSGSGASGGFDSHLMHDATDCREAMEAGTVTFAGGGSPDAGSIDYGDDSGDWANDGECDDPRFSGSGASDGFDSHLMHDASDCREAMEAGTVTFAGGSSGSVGGGDIDYGDDSGEWANDGECDDPRFSGSGASDGFDSHLMHDASDCRAAMEAGTVTFAGGGSSDAGSIDYGDDTGEWANDSECDDPRFSGSGSSGGIDDHLMHDATDCREAMEAGTVTFAGGGSSNGGSIDYGDDSGEWSHDGECDDPRFSGSGASDGFESHLMHDASDCRAAMDAGTVTFAGGSVSSGGPFSYGDDESVFAFDGVCDDPRFEGPGMDATQLAVDMGHDASDCRAAVDAGEASIRSQFAD